MSTYRVTREADAAVIAAAKALRRDIVDPDPDLLTPNLAELVAAVDALQALEDAADLRTEIASRWRALRDRFLLSAPLTQPGRKEACTGVGHYATILGSWQSSLDPRLACKKHAERYRDLAVDRAMTDAWMAEAGLDERPASWQRPDALELVDRVAARLGLAVHEEAVPA
jgi:hypothetical protein